MNIFKRIIESIIISKSTNKYGVELNLHSIHNGIMHTSYKGIMCLKCPFDYVSYQMLLWEVKPDLIIEIGTLSGGGALYLADILDQIGKGIIHTIDIKNQSHPLANQHPRIKFFRNGWEQYMLPDKRKFKKIMVIDDGAHIYEQVKGALEKFSPLVSKDSYYIVEDGILTELEMPIKYHGGPTRATEEFIASNPNFIVDRRWTDRYGHNTTYNPNGYLRRI